MASNAEERVREPQLSVAVTCAGVTIGHAVFALPEGLAHTELVPNGHYTMIAEHGRHMGEWLSKRHHWDSAAGDFADQATRLWTGERLALDDAMGRELRVGNVIVAEGSRAIFLRPPIQVVADFRPESARVEALISSVDLDAGSGGHPSPRRNRRR